MGGMGAVDHVVSWSCTVARSTVSIAAPSVSPEACAQRDRVIASYTLLSAICRLDVKTLVLNTPDYLPEVHYHQVRDAWHGLRTPSGAVRERDAATDLKDA